MIWKEQEENVENRRRILQLHLVVDGALTWHTKDMDWSEDFD